MDDYYDPTDEREAEGDYLLSEEQYARQSAAIRRYVKRYNLSEAMAEQEARYEAWRLKPTEAEECAA